MGEKRYWKIASIDSQLQTKVDDALDTATEKLFALYPDGIELPNENVFAINIDGQGYVIKGMNKDNAITCDGEEIDLCELSQWECLTLLRKVMFALEDTYLTDLTEED